MRQFLVETFLLSAIDVEVDGVGRDGEGEDGDDAEEGGEPRYPER
jgi:hypothetical protein